jgi:hypothetical protein
MEGFCLLGTGLLLLRRDQRVSPVAAVTAALLLVDAWFDVTTSSSGRALVVALAMALLVELPLCALCALIAARGLEFDRRRRADAERRLAITAREAALTKATEQAERDSLNLVDQLAAADAERTRRRHALMWSRR